jgi:hypothetical protein
VTAELERRRSRAGLRVRRKSSQHDQQALRGDRIGDDDPDERSPKPSEPVAPEHQTFLTVILKTVKSKVNAGILERLQTMRRLVLGHFGGMCTSAPVLEQYACRSRRQERGGATGVGGEADMPLTPRMCSL